MKSKNKMTHMSVQVKASMIVMGTGQLMYHQWIKGFLYLAVLIAAILYFILTGVSDVIGFFTLGTVEADPWLGTQGDDSVIMLLRGLFSFMVMIAVVLVYRSNVKDIVECDKKVHMGKELPAFGKAVSIFLDRKFYIVALALPVAGVLVFQVIPIVFMILIAFTNYGGGYRPSQTG